MQKIKTKSINAQDPKYESIFSGLIFCADCKHSMIRKYNRRGQHEFVGYMCSTYKTHGNRVCTSHSVDYEELTDAVLCIGQAGGRPDLTPERIAINMDDARIPDNEGNRPVDEPIRNDGQAA